MRIRITMPAKDGKRIKDEILNNIEKVEEDDWSEEWELVRYSPCTSCPSYQDTDLMPLLACFHNRLV